MYIASAYPVSFYNGVFKLVTESELCRTMVEGRYKGLIEKCLSGIAGETVTIELDVRRDEEPAAVTAADEKPASSEFLNSLNPQYTFENFVVGSSHQYAYATAYNASQHPGKNYNPLFLYGHSGLGKTHLMQAIGNEILRLDPTKKVLYVTSERFTNDLINSIREKSTEAFRQHYRDVDALLVDDVQFIQGKDNIQEEFFHTFNDLHAKNKQIVITSDRKPKELVVLEERLRNRFEWGLITDMVMPDFETRVAILQKKAESQNAHINNEVLQYIAQRINTSIRELEGALCKLTAYAGISGQKIDIPLAEHVLKDIFPEDIKITSRKIIEKVSTYYKITENDILGKARNKNFALPRQVAMYLCKTLTDLNYVVIGQDFGNKDRTTVMHNVDKIAEQIKTDQKLKADIEFIKNDLQSL
jgi:chromosomal replication initiator protein